MLIQRFILILPMVLAGACTLGPNYTRPPIETPGAFRGAEAPATAASLADVQPGDLFQDPALTSLIETAREHNFDLRIAAERIVQARAAYRIRRADRFPTIDASASVVNTGAPENGAAGSRPDGNDRSTTYTDAGFSLSWEVDAFGRLRRLTEAAHAQYAATEEARRAVVVTLVADVMDSYLALRALDLEFEIALRTQSIATDGLRLTEARRERGIATALDVRQAEQLLFTARGRLAAVQREITQVENALSLLLGRQPGGIDRGVPLESLRGPAEVPAGLPSALLERRPDIRQVEQELIAANARIGAARAEYFPRISLTGFLGVQSRELSSLLTGSAGLWSATASAIAPIFNAGRTTSNVQVTESVQRELVIIYQRTVYNALREVSDALAAYRRTGEQRAEQERLVDALRASTRLSTQRYESGLDSYLQVLDAQRNLFQGELELARIRQQELASIVLLYRALGGGWRDVARPSDGLPESSKVERRTSKEGRNPEGGNAGRKAERRTSEEGGNADGKVEGRTSKDGRTVEVGRDEGRKSERGTIGNGTFEGGRPHRSQSSTVDGRRSKEGTRGGNGAGR